MADSEVELDDDAIDEALDRQMSYMANQMMAQGIQLDQYLQMTGMDEEKLREQGIEYDKEKLEHKQID